MEAGCFSRTLEAFYRTALCDIAVTAERSSDPTYYVGRTKTVTVSFAVLTAVVMKSSVFWDITLCRNKSPPSSGQKNKPSKKLAGKYAGFLLGLFLSPEDGGDMFRRNVC
jgi:hypothetical protein